MLSVKVKILALLEPQHHVFFHILLLLLNHRLLLSLFLSLIDIGDLGFIVGSGELLVVDFLGLLHFHFLADIVHPSSIIALHFGDIASLLVGC